MTDRGEASHRRWLLASPAARGRSGGSGRFASPGASHVEQDLAGYDLVDEAHLAGPAWPDRASGQDQVERRRDPDQSGEALGAPGAGEQPDLHLGLAELGPGFIVGADPHRARQGQFHAATQTGSVDGGDHRLPQLGVEPFQPVVDLLARPHGLLGLLGGVEAAEEPADVGAGDEAVRLGGADDDGRDVGVALDSLDDGLHVLHEAGEEGVHLLPRPVDQHRGDAIIDRETQMGEAQLCGGHGGPSYRSRTTAAPRPPAAHWVTRAVPPSRRSSSLAIVKI